MLGGVKCLVLDLVLISKYQGLGLIEVSGSALLFMKSEFVIKLY